jgi:ferric iron reductase protein FhuF
MMAIEVLPPERAGLYAYANGCLRLPDGDDIPARPDAATLSGAIGRYLEGFPGADRRAAVSMWTQYYFSYLVLPALAALFIGSRSLPVRLDEVGLGLKPDGLPDHFVLPHAGAAASWDALARSGDLLRGHVEPVVALLAVETGVSRRLLWSNVAVQVAGFADMAEAMGPDLAHAADAADLLLTTPRWPDGAPNPLCDSMRLAGGAGATERLRRVCCLRYNLPGFADCPGCPLPPERRGRRGTSAG